MSLLYVQQQTQKSLHKSCLRRETRPCARFIPHFATPEHFSLNYSPRGDFALRPGGTRRRYMFVYERVGRILGCAVVICAPPLTMRIPRRHGRIVSPREPGPGVGGWPELKASPLPLWRSFGPVKALSQAVFLLGGDNDSVSCFVPYVKFNPHPLDEFRGKKWKSSQVVNPSRI